MDTNTKKKLAKSYGGYSKAELEETLKRAEAFLANPGEANAEAIQGAKDTIEYITEVLTEPAIDLAAENEKLRKENDSLKASQPKNAREVAAKVAVGLSREQAEAVVGRKKDFTERFQKHVKSAA